MIDKVITRQYEHLPDDVWAAATRLRPGVEVGAECSAIGTLGRT
jgi:hypothetical protein